MGDTYFDNYNVFFRQVHYVAAFPGKEWRRRFFNESSCLAPALGVTKFTIVTDMILGTLCCATSVDKPTSGYRCPVLAPSSQTVGS
jgi:hypothetical protein